MMSWYGKVIAALSLIFALLVGGVVAVSYDRSYFDDLRAFLLPSDTCSKPCFLGIQPGSTSREDATRVLNRAFDIETLYFGDRSSLYWSGQSTTALNLSVRSGRLIFRDTTLRRIYLRTDLSLGEIQLALGQPARVLVYETIVFGAKPYLLVYPQYDLYLVIDPYLCTLDQWNLWSMTRGVNIAIGDTVVVEQIIPYPLTSFTELDVRRWATQLRRFNYCKNRR